MIRLKKSNIGITRFFFLCILYIFPQQVTYAQTYSNLIPDSVVEPLLTTVLNTKDVYETDTKTKNQKAIYNQFVAWHPYAFLIPDSLFPKNEKALLAFIQDEQGIYHNNYVFKDAVIDNALTYADKQYILEQSNQQTTNVTWDWNNKNIHFTKKLNDKKYNIRYAFSIPVFSQNLTVAIIQQTIYSRPINSKKNTEDTISSSFHYFTWDATTQTWKYMGNNNKM